MSTFTQFKRTFDTSVTINDIKLDWDSGHCYSFIDHPVMRLIDELEDEDERNQWDDYANDFMFDNVVSLDTACRPEIGPDGTFSTMCGCHNSADHSKEENIGYLQSFINAVNNSAASSAKEFYTRELIPEIKELIERLSLDEVVEKEVLSTE